VAGKLEVLREHCEREGTSYDAIRKTILWTAPFEPTDTDPFLDQMRAMADIGVEEVHVMPSGADQVAFVRALGDHVVPVLWQL
jgi:hypothetical protein